MFDVGIALIACILLSPVYLGAAIWIIAEDGGPILFRQHRVGRDGAVFSILKFRTMRTARSGPSLRSRGMRESLVGKTLRKYKLDELPQFFNVLRGEMSLIGPRPEVPEYVQADDQVWRAVLRVRPGITDLASLAFRNEEDLLAPAEDPIESTEPKCCPRNCA